MKQRLKSYLSESPRARKVSGWLTVMGRWLKEGWAVWLTLGVLVAALAYLHCVALPSDNEERARIVGTVLQLAGITTVFLGYEKTRRQFHGEGAFGALWNWLKSIPLQGPKPIDGIANASLPSVTAAAVGGITVTRADRTLEQRLAELETSVREVENALKVVRADLRKEQVERVRAVQTIQRELTAQTKTTMTLLESVHTGGLSMSISGLLWLAVGVVVATFPQWFAP